ncbi:MAG TPA: ribbon-helix-helix domain-containing protein [Paracoccaceae bacterium]|nr:ribbon-helix-helix domain-containing protein [Paracoccaceae bacterium]
MSSARPVKHSLTLSGHRTSVSLEEAFWAAFRAIARAEGRSVNALAAEIDAARGPGTGLASAIRVFVLEHALARPGVVAGDPHPLPPPRVAREPPG